MEELNLIGERAKKAKKELALLTTQVKNDILQEAAHLLRSLAQEIIAANQKDMENARAKGLSKGLLDRLYLDNQRIESMAQGLEEIIRLPDIIGNLTHMTKRPNGLLIGQKIVPIGVIGVIYEARPNVTVDVFGLSIKTGNSLILKGGRDGIHSNIMIEKILHQALESKGISKGGVQLIKDTSRESTLALMRMNQYIDLLIPRGGASLIQSVVENATIPVIETGTGNCHCYVEKTGDFDMARRIILNGKTQRVGVCNALESLVIDEAIAPMLLPLIEEDLSNENVIIYGDEKASQYLKKSKLATKEDFGKEYLDYKISIKIVSSYQEAIEHINQYSTHHSETIITNDYQISQRFLEEIDSACVYVNASTRFTDGFEFGYGAEIGISTQKLHARGPMGLSALTTQKYIIYGDGHIR